MRKRLSYANVTATIALFIALGGVSWAATSLPANSVGTRQIVDRGVGTNDIADRAVTANKIARGGVDTVNMSAAAVAALKGQKGDAGPAGAKGDTGDAGANIRFVSLPETGPSVTGAVTPTAGADLVESVTADSSMRTVKLKFPIDNCVISGEVNELPWTYVVPGGFGSGDTVLNTHRPGIVGIERGQGAIDVWVWNTGPAPSAPAKSAVRLAFVCPS